MLVRWLVRLILVVLLLIGRIHAEDEDDEDDDARHRFSIPHFTPEVHHFGIPVLPLGLRTTKTRPLTNTRAPAITPSRRIILSDTTRTVTRTPQTTVTEATTATTSAKTTTTSRPKREQQPSKSAATTLKTDIECGKAFKGPSRLIVGGRNADPFEWPWMVALLERKDQEQFCGGVLLTERHVLTAAHCFNGRRTREVDVVLGEYNLFRDQGYEEYFSISNLERHPDFADRDSHYRNDLAILTLEKSAKFNSAIRPVCLPSSDAQDFTGLNATALGWGDTDGDEFIESWAHVLQEVEIPVVGQEECDSRHADIPIKPEIEICAAAFDGGRDTCTGDSGGPLLVQVDKRWAVIGLVSWGPTRCGSGLPGVYTRVDGFLDWIWDQIR